MPVTRSQTRAIARQVERTASRARSAVGAAIASGAAAASRYFTPVSAGDVARGARRLLSSSRRSSSASSNPFVASMGPRTSNVRNFGDAQQAGFKRSGPKTTKLRKGQKKVKITRQFKKKVDAALSKLSPSGYYQERFYNKFKPVDFRQTVQDIGGGNYNGEFGTTNGTLHMFDPIRVLDCASVLFNDKVPIANKSLGDPGNFDAQSFSVDVLRQWVEINIKNNSARNIEVKIWTWELKKPQVGSNVNFGAEWINSFTREATPTDGKINQLGMAVDVIGVSPLLSPAMRERFSIEEKIILLEAGKYFKHTVQGPRKLYNFPAFGQATGFNNAQKGNKGVHMAIMVDNSSTTTFGNNNSHRVTDIAPNDGFGILTETIYNYVIRLPEQAGFKYPAAYPGGLMQTLKQRRHGPYAIKIWNDPGTQPGTVTEIPDENPQNQGTTGI